MRMWVIAIKVGYTTHEQCYTVECTIVSLSLPYKIIKKNKMECLSEIQVYMCKELRAISEPLNLIFI